jgi:hypothetical protein
MKRIRIVVAKTQEKQMMKKMMMVQTMLMNQATSM